MSIPAKELVLYFGRLYSEKIGERYPPSWGRDMRIFKDLLKDFSQEKLKDVLDLYFVRPRKIYSIPFFKNELGDLLQFLQHYLDNEPKTIEDNESWRFE